MRKDPSIHAPADAAERRLTIGSSELSDGASLSGHERNHLFVNDGNGGLTDVSGLSGLDDPADGRAVAWLDFDRDGWLDFAVTNANAPTLQLYRNHMQSLPAATARGAIAVRLVGGNRSARASDQWSNRDGIGARIEVVLGDRRLVRELRAGEGFAAQNSAVTYVGIGGAPHADDVRVRWPSGNVQSAGPIRAGDRVTFYEDPEQAPSRRPTVSEPIAAEQPTRPPHVPDRDTLELSSTAGAPRAPLRVLTTTATWCESCRSELPDVALLRETFPEDALEIVALPVDESDTEDKLRAYVQAYAPRYRMLYDRSEADIERAQAVIERSLRRDVLPASIVTKDDDRIVGVYWGLPTVSDLRAIQDGLD